MRWLRAHWRAGPRCRHGAHHHLRMSPRSRRRRMCRRQTCRRTCHRHHRHRPRGRCRQLKPLWRRALQCVVAPPWVEHPCLRRPRHPAASVTENVTVTATQSQMIRRRTMTRPARCPPSPRPRLVRLGGVVGVGQLGRCADAGADAVSAMVQPTAGTHACPTPHCAATRVARHGAPAYARTQTLHKRCAVHREGLFVCAGLCSRGVLAR